MPNATVRALAGLTLSALAATPALGASCLPEARQPALSKSIAVGIVQSAQGHSNDVGVIRNIFTATKAKLDASGATLTVLSDADVANPSALADLKVIILPEVKGLTRAQRRSLNGWVRNGGGLVSLYFDARDDEAGTPLIRLPEGWGGRSEWAELSPAMGARFVNDVYMQEASFELDAQHPVTQAAAIFCGGQVPDYNWRRKVDPQALTGELAVSASRNFQALGRLKTSKITYSKPEKRAVPGSVFAWTNTYRAGRVVKFGFNFVDAWQPWTFESYYKGVDPTAPDTGVALLRGAITWAAGAPA